MRRKRKLVNEEVYHVFNKSIAGFKIFNNEKEFLRMKNITRYYQIKNPPNNRFSWFMEELKKIREEFNEYFTACAKNKPKLVQIITYCLMPTHVHFILKQLKEGGVQTFMSGMLASYSHWFNLKHKRKGPLWQHRFKNVLVDTDEQLIHLSRYIHLNPVKAGLIDKPEEWAFSSYNEYLLNVKDEDRICNYGGLLDIEPRSYEEFTKDSDSYQKELPKIQHLLFD